MSSWSDTHAKGNSRQHNGHVYNNSNINTNNTTSPQPTLPQRRQRGFLSSLWDDSAKLDKQLLQAAEEGQLHRVRYLLNSGADVDFTSNLGKTALYFATIKGRKDVVEALIFAGANVNHEVQDDYGFHTVLQDAIHSKNEDIARMLIAAGAKHSPMTLYNAASGGLLGVVQALVAAGADLEAKVGFRKNTVSLLEDQLAELRRQSSVVDAEHSLSEWPDLPTPDYEMLLRFSTVEPSFWRSLTAARSFNTTDESKLQDVIEFLQTQGAR